MLKLYNAICEIDRGFRWRVCMGCGILANVLGESDIAACFFAAAMVITINR